MTELEKMAAEATYIEVQRWVYALLWKARRRWPLLDHEKSLRAAYYGYCQAYATYNPEHGSFTNWIAIKVKAEIIDLIRKEIIDAKRATKFVRNFSLPESSSEDGWNSSEPQTLEELIPQPTAPEFDVADWMAHLSEDGQIIAKLVFDPPIDIKLLLKQIGEKKKVAWRKAIKAFLKEINWSTRRIRAVFAEIRSKL